MDDFSDLLSGLGGTIWPMEVGGLESLGWLEFYCPRKCLRIMN